MSKELIEIGEAAKRMGVTIRALHYYDQIGLLVPQKYTGAKYRLYSEKELERLEQILFLKEIGFELKEIKELLNAPNYDEKEVYKRQRALLLEKRREIDRMLERLDILIEGKKITRQMMGNAKEKVQSKAMGDQKIIALQKQYYREILELYGHTQSFEQFETRSLKQGKEQLWKNMNDEASELFGQIAMAREKGEKAGSPFVQQLIKAWQDYISKTQYECTMEILEGLGKLYVSDQRFYNYYEGIQSGLADFIAEAIAIYVSSARE